MTTTTTTASHPASQGESPLVGLRAHDVMTGDVATVLTTTTVGEALELMRTLNIRHLPVLGDGRFVGLVDDRMVAFSLLSTGGPDGVLEQPVSTAMTHYVPHVAPGDPLDRVAHVLRTSRCDAVVVVDAQARLLGIITMVDVVTAVALGSATQQSVPRRAGGPPGSVGAVADMPVAMAGARS
jgi:CBS domain-containing protein